MLRDFFLLSGKAELFYQNNLNTAADAGTNDITLMFNWYNFAPALQKHVYLTRSTTPATNGKNILNCRMAKTGNGQLCSGSQTITPLPSPQNRDRFVERNLLCKPGRVYVSERSGKRTENSLSH